MSVRTILFWMHLVTGIAAAAIVFLMSVTGVALTYQRQLTELAIREYRSDAPEQGAEPLAIGALLDRVGEQVPDFEASSLTIKADPAEPAQVRKGRRARLYVDRYTGEVLGDGSSRTSAFMQTMVSWHRWLGQEGEGRQVGKAVTGACNLGFFFLVVSGIVLWWPRKWSRRAVGNVALFRGGLGGKARDFNWHNVIGLWMFVPLLVVVASGVVISYRWAGDLVFTAFGEDSPAGRAAGPGARGPRLERVSVESPEVPREPRTLDELLSIAASDTPGWRSLTLDPPEFADEPVRVSIDTSPGGQPAKTSRITLDRFTGEILSREKHADLSRGRQARSWLRFAHTGEVYGFVGQTIAGLASLGAAVLVWTGLALSWRRFFGRG